MNPNRLDTLKTLFNDRNGNDLVHYDFLLNDGFSYSKFIIDDPPQRVFYKNRFLKLSADENDQSFVVQTEFEDKH